MKEAMERDTISPEAESAVSVRPETRFAFAALRQKLGQATPGDIKALSGPRKTDSPVTSEMPVAEALDRTDPAVQGALNVVGQIRYGVRSVDPN